MWILPDADDRPRLSPAFFRPFVNLVLADGQVYVTDDHTGAALWLDVDVSVDSAGDNAELQQALIDGLGADYAKRFFTLAELFDAEHPAHESHAYLLFVGVVPEVQDQGIGTAVLLERLGELDRIHRSAYLEASSERNAALYTRLGFAPIGESVALPDGPTIYPMWRAPFAAETATRASF